MGQNSCKLFANTMGLQRQPHFSYKIVVLYIVVVCNYWSRCRSDTMSAIFLHKNFVSINKIIIFVPKFFIFNILGGKDGEEEKRNEGDAVLLQGLSMCSAGDGLSHVVDKRRANDGAVPQCPWALCTAK